MQEVYRVQQERCRLHRFGPLSAAVIEQFSEMLHHAFLYFINEDTTVLTRMIFRIFRDKMFRTRYFLFNMG